MLTSLRSRILVVFIGLIVIVQMATIAGLAMSINSSAEETAERELALGEQVMRRLLSIETDKLISESASIGADDTFRQQLVQGNIDSIHTALVELAEERKFEMMVLLDHDARHVTANNQKFESPVNYTELLSAEQLRTGATSALVYDKIPYLISIMPIKNAGDIGWSIIGKPLDQAYAKSFQLITGLALSFVNETSSITEFLVSTVTTEERVKNQTKHFDKKYMLFDSSDNTIYALLETSKKKSLKPFKLLELQLSWIVFFSMSLAVLFALVLTRVLNEPVQALIDGANRVSRGEYHKPIQNRANIRELHILAMALNKMQMEISAREKKILHQVNFDALTGLPNRNYIHLVIDGLLQKTVQDGEITAILRISIDGFKQVNDTFGHKVGDLFLCLVSKRLLTHGENDLHVARVGGDEFLLIYTEVSEPELSSKIRNLQVRLEESFDVDQLILRGVFNIGVAVAPLHGTNTDQLLRRSDIAMHTAKTNKLGFAFYEIGQDEKHLKQISLINDLKIAIKENQLTLHYQPKWSLASHSIERVEALVRWNHPQLGFIPPDEFIPLAERSGIIMNLTTWVLHQVVRQWNSWVEQGFNMKFSVNLSAHDLAQKNFPDFVAGIIYDNKIPENTLTFEITESAVMQDSKQAIGTLVRLRKLGVLLSLDDFGTGFSSLSQIKSMPVDELKIDKSFVLNLHQSVEDQTIVMATIKLAHNLGMKVVAEGVENQEAWDLLAQYGCEELQGYFITRPLAANDYVVWHKKRIELTTDSYSSPRVG